MITFKDNAAKKVQTILDSEDDKTLNLRVYVNGGGCSGFQYGFTLDSNIAEDDTLVVNGNVKLLIDSVSIEYLNDSIIDYIEDLTSSQFIIKNPNATSTCGCGSSFTV